MTLLLLSRGVPMILAGDEFCNSQRGNNNAYCQDSPISWLDWSDLERNHDVFTFVKTLIAFRSEYPVLRRRDFYTGMNRSGYPELSFHGTKAWNLNQSKPFHTFGFMFAETRSDHGAQRDCFIYCGVNTYWKERTLELPVIPSSMQWHRVVYTASEVLADSVVRRGSIDLDPRSIMVLIAR